MNRRYRQRAMLAIAAAAVAVGAIASSLDTRGGPSGETAAARTRLDSHVSGAPSRSELAAAAAYLGVTSERLTGELRSGRTLAQLAGARPDRSAAGLIDALVAARVARLRASDSVTARSVRIASLRRRIASQVSGVAPYVGLPTSARYLGVSVARLDGDLQTGRSLAQIADATPGRSAMGLIDARIGAREAKLRSALAAGKLTKSAAEDLLARLRRRVSAEVDRVGASS
jgi:hypothetical protein